MDNPEKRVTACGIRFWRLAAAQPGVVHLNEYTLKPPTIIISAASSVLSRDEARLVAAALSAFAETGRLPDPGGNE